MCTLAFALRPAPGILFAASGNRNEFLARPSRGPLVEGGIMPALLPRDVKSGGSWLGLNARGLFVCLTNRRGAVLDPGRRSRGELVVEALRGTNASEVKERIAKLPGDRHNGFHLVFADAREAWVAICDGSRLELRPVRPGELLVVTERSYGAGQGVREGEVRRECHPLFAAPGLSAATLRPPMQRHGLAPLMPTSWDTVPGRRCNSWPARTASWNSSGPRGTRVPKLQRICPHGRRRCCAAETVTSWAARTPSRTSGRGPATRAPT